MFSFFEASKADLNTCAERRQRNLRALPERMPLVHQPAFTRLLAETLLSSPSLNSINSLGPIDPLKCAYTNRCRVKAFRFPPALSVTILYLRPLRSVLTGLMVLPVLLFRTLPERLIS